jgi:hypothetical protein
MPRCLGANGLSVRPKSDAGFIRDPTHNHKMINGGYINGGGRCAAAWTSLLSMTPVVAAAGCGPYCRTIDASGPPAIVESGATGQPTTRVGLGLPQPPHEWRYGRPVPFARANGRNSPRRPQRRNDHEMAALEERLQALGRLELQAENRIQLLRKEAREEGQAGRLEASDAA